jgi:hypothetical protein
MNVLMTLKFSISKVEFYSPSIIFLLLGYLLFSANDNYLPPTHKANAHPYTFTGHFFKKPVLSRAEIQNQKFLSISFSNQFSMFLCFAS